MENQVFEGGAELVGDRDLVAVQARARVWLIEAAFPRWGTTGRTESGLFAERMSLLGQPDESYFRTFVQARHIYAFAESGEIGWEGPQALLVRQTMDRLLASARRHDGLFVHRLSVDAGVIDGRADLYDQAFVLFALGMTGQLLSEDAYYDEAERFVARLSALWKRPDGGFHEGEIVDLSIRRQNPHMHLLEAFLCLHDASGRESFLQNALEIASLCGAKFIDEATGALLEYFDADWHPAAGQAGTIVEPGHCFEWAWLFERLGRIGWKQGVDLADQLVAFARQFGICAERGVAINEVDLSGQVINGDARLWPQTERLKAAVARYRRIAAPTELAEIVDAASGLDKYLLVDQPGLWRDKLRVDGTWIDELAPGSSLYHIVCGYAELLRI
jgi:mannose/cellobiose epimerase-like protein (N-acyl-D-glucosamine 2-epimerase family)